MHRLAIMGTDWSATIGKTMRAPVEEAVVELIHGTSLWVVPVDVDRALLNQEGLFAIILGMPYLVRLHERMRIIGIGLSHEVVLFPFFWGDRLMSSFALLMFLPIQPFRGGAGM